DAGSAEACRATHSLARACDLGNGGACAELASQKQDRKKAAPLYIKSCELGDPRYCYEAGLTLADHSRAAEAYEIACRGGESRAGRNRGSFYEKGDGVAKDVKRAAELYENSCSGIKVDKPNGLACYNLSNFLRHGIGVPEDKVRADLLLEHACSLGVQEACAAIRKPSS